MPTLNLTAKIGADGRGFKAGLKETEVAANRWAGNLKGQLATVFSAAAVTAFAKNVADTVGRIKDLGTQYTMTTAEVQRADVALKQNGLQFENLGQAILKLGHARREAVEGNEDLRETFAKYGATLTDLNSPQMRNYDILLKMTQAMSGMNLTAREQTELQDILGDRSGKILTTLQELSQFDGIKIFEDADIQRIDAAAKKLEEVKRQLTILAAENLLEAPNLRIRDFMASLFTPEFLEGMGVNAGATPGADSGPVSDADVAAANARKWFRLHQQWESGQTEETGLFEVDKDRKRSATGGSPGRPPTAFRINSPNLGGLASAGGFSAGIAGMDPRLFIEQTQLGELKSLNAKVNQIQQAIGSKMGSVAGLLGALKR